MAMLITASTNLQANAAIAFDKNLLIVDPLFTDHGSMSVSEIQAFLDGEGTLLASWVDSVEMRRPSDNCVVHYPTGMTAAQVIYEAATSWGAQVYDGSGCAISGAYWSDPAYSNYTLETISPKALLVLLQKEQSLISANGTYSTNSNDYKDPSCCSSNEYKLARATGYGVPDAGSINEKYLGFYNQINWAAWQLRFNYERSAGNTGWDEVDYLTYSGPMIEGTWKRCGSCSAETFDGYYPIDGSPLYMDNRSTASLYYYTPHTYPGFVGNYNFVQFYNDWFGNPYINIPWAFGVQSITAYVDPARTMPFTDQSRLDLVSGDLAYMSVVVRNAGNQVWSQGTVKLSTSNPIDRSSQWADSSWNSANRVVTMDEVAVSNGQSATFEFSVTAPSLSAGYYTERFGIVVEGVAWMLTESIALPFSLNELDTPDSTFYQLTTGRLDQNQYLVSQDRHSVLVLRPNNKLTEYSDFQSAWSPNPSNTDGNNYLLMQSDGNLVLYGESGSPKWNSGTAGNPGAYAQLNTDGGLQIIASDNTTVLWQNGVTIYPDYLKQTNNVIDKGSLYSGQTLTTADRKFRLTLQQDGNLVLYSPTKAIWATFRFSPKVSRLQMQSDGNLVAYDTDNKAFWTSKTNGHPNSRLVLQPDGNLVIYSAANKVLWHTATWGAE